MIRSQSAFKKARPRLPESVNTLLTNHGRVAVAFNSMFRGMLLKLTSTASFEHLCVRISSSSETVIGLVVYRRGAASSLFYNEFENTLGILATYNEKVLSLGDFVLLLHCFTMNLKTPWVFWPHTMKRFCLWVISIFTWSSLTTQMHKHFSKF